MEEIQEILAAGLQRLSQKFPWVAGQVTCNGASATDTGVWSIKPLDSTPKMVLKDIRSNDEVLSMQEWEDRAFPMRELDENIFAPRNTSSGRAPETIAEVFQLQATRIKGGLVLTFLGQHQAVDGTGLAQIIRLFSKACCNDVFTEDELEIGNLSAKNYTALFDSTWKPGPELVHNIVINTPQDTIGSPQTIVPKDPGVWSLFQFTAASLGQLKHLATKHLPTQSQYISKDDALSAFVWQAITRARSVRFDAQTTMLFARAVDLRRFLNISPTHPGFVQGMTYHSSTVHDLSNQPLGHFAADLRAAVDPTTSALPYYARSFATLISRTPDKSRTSYIAGFDLSRDVMLSSWVNQDSYELAFGLGVGPPKPVRRPTFPSFPGLVYLLPKDLAGGVSVAVCLSEEDGARLAADGEFLQYATYIG